MSRFMVTHSLLSSWLYAMRDDPMEDATTKADHFADFMMTLRREPTKTSPAMQDGNNFESLVTAVLQKKDTISFPEINHKTGKATVFSGAPADHRWYESASTVANLLAGSQLQYKASRIIHVQDEEIFLYGRLDALKGGTIYDIKFSRGYERGKYISSTQHPMYMELVPEAERFVYVISGGTEVWTESYRRSETPSIVPTIADFLSWLQAMDLMPLYQEKWLARDQEAKK